MTVTAESLRTAFLRRQPDFPLLGVERPGVTEDFLRQRGWMVEGERFLGATRAGEGNMNLTLRVRTDRRSLILKQARPWVEKYDWIAAPFERALVERRFYDRVQSIPSVGARMPRLEAHDADARALLLEDLAEGVEDGVADFTSLYTSGEMGVEDVRALGAYLRELHRETRGTVDESLANREMRALNHEHIFRVPYSEDNGVELDARDAGLVQTVAKLRADAELARRVGALGERYLADGECLVHGDFFPGSWLSTPDGPRVIDPEFCFPGDPEFDIGIGVAHLVMARQAPELCSLLIETAAGEGCSPGLVARFAGVEVIRRIAGVAQLPIPPESGRRAQLLEQARGAVLDGALEAFIHA